MTDYNLVVTIRVVTSADDHESHRKSKSLAVLVLGILGTERPDALSLEITSHVTNALLDLLYQENNAKLRVAAVELLGRGFVTWSEHIDDVNSVVQKLFKLSLVPDTPGLALAAHHAIMLIGTTQ